LAEPIDIDDLQTLFEDNWDLRSGSEIPQPEFTTSDVAREDPSLQWAATPRRAFVNIYLQEVVDMQDGYAYDHVRIRATVMMDIWTRREVAATGATGRQYLHDVKQELRRIIYANKHSMTNWQIMKYGGFEEKYEDSGSVRFHGQMRLTLENDGIATNGKELVDEDLFNRADAAIGAEWTADTGTWEVVGNQAALQSATADAIARFTVSTWKKNHRIQVDLITVASMDAGIIFRHSASTDYWLAKLVNSGGVDYLRLIDNTGGTPVQRAEIREPNGGWTNGDRVELAVDLYNDCFNIAYNGMMVLAIESGSHGTDVGYGLYSNDDQDTRFDNFHIFESGGSGR
jgi:hypothetical protein